jgi:hypothetical protein
LVVLLHASVALLVLHLLPQPPQLLVVVIGVSQPFAMLPSQLAKPASHWIVQVDPTQVATALAWLHFSPHAPQLFGSFVVSISQPFAILLSQFW